MRKVVQIIGVPIDLGQSHSGEDQGAGALRYAGLAARLEELGYTVYDSENLTVPVWTRGLTLLLCVASHIHRH
ncbi:MAG: hypothetical protein RQ722_02695 [Desulfuromonadales bacterium]|nr:hypothetical protein [Desulfuromonadales bacterium]